MNRNDEDDSELGREKKIILLMPRNLQDLLPDMEGELT